MTRKPSDRDQAKGAASGPAPIALPPPALEGRGTLVAALRRRRTIREIGAAPLPLQTLSDLLWAACGVNRKRGPFGASGRTAGSASNSQEIDVYVVLKEGTYLYDALVNRLTPVAAGDLRPLAISHGQGGGETAPVRLVYVADIDRLANTAGFAEPGLRDPDVQRSYYYVDAGMIAANVYLFAASLGLAAWFHNCDKPGLAAKLNLRPDQRPLFAQTVGYPAK
ncbi:MAG: nitroreductase family protein [Roseiarcus sp.]|jgi:nitroreductase|uniref:nitroreductase family protein n=1 Tax=Roseiarcus sp. TaxID=1969460 RepID=UPI003C24645C